MIRGDPRDPDGHSGAGAVLALGGDAQGALMHFQEALNLGDERAETRLHMGNACRTLDMHDEAAECYRDALKKRPGLAPAHFGMAYLNCLRRNHAAAAESADEALRHDPLLSEAGIVKAVALLGMGERDEALEMISEAVRGGSDPAKIGLGYALLSDGDAEGALECFDGVAGADPVDPEGHCARARKLSERGDHAGAYEAYSAAAEIEHLARLYAAMAASVVRMRGPGREWRDEALALAVKAIGKDTSYAFEQYGRARKPRAPQAAGGDRGTRLDDKVRLDATMRLLTEPGNEQRVLSVLRALVRDDPGFADARAALGMALGVSGDADGALAELQEALRLGAADARVYNNLGNAYSEKGMAKEAEECYKSVPPGPGQDEALVNLSRLLTDRGRAREGLKAAERALRLSPDSPRAAMAKGEALAGLGRIRESIRLLRGAVRSMPREFHARMGLGAALAAGGDAAGALRCFEEAALLEPDSAAAHHERGNMLGRLERHQESYDAYAKAAELGPLPQTWANMAAVLLGIHADDGPGASEAWRAEALALADKALEMDPDYAFGHFIKSRLLAVMGRDAEAEEHLLHARMLDPDFLWDDTGAHLARGAGRKRRQR